MNSHFFSRVELVFWNFAIRALSQSQVARAALRRAYRMTNTTEVSSIGILMGVSGMVGLISGYLFYFLSTNIR